MSPSPAVIVFDVNETLSDMSPMDARFADVGAPSHLAKLWFATLLRDGFALTAAGGQQPFAEFGVAALRTVLHGVRLDRGLDAAIGHVMDGFGELSVHPDVAEGVHALRRFTASLKGQRRAWLPMNSSMIATEPLGPEVWEAIGWAGRETLGDMAHAYMYAQRTADDRIALGGRGVPYRFGSRTDNDGRTQEATVTALREILVRFFPQLAGVAISHAWSGVLGVPRDWCASVALDRTTGLGWAGGYVGSGVATANLAARTLRDLVRRDSGEGGTDLTTLPWVGHRVRMWEPEPLRWLGVRGMYAAYRGADRRERRAPAPRRIRLRRWQIVWRGAVETPLGRAQPLRAGAPPSGARWSRGAGPYPGCERVRGARVPGYPPTRAERVAQFPAPLTGLSTAGRG